MYSLNVIILFFFVKFARLRQGAELLERNDEQTYQNNAATLQHRKERAIAQ
jgi:hypothetical protein